MGLLLQYMDSMVRIALAIEREVEDAQSIRDAGASVKRKENQPSSSRKKAEEFYFTRFQEIGSQLLGPRPGSIIPRWGTLQDS